MSDIFPSEVEVEVAEILLQLPTLIAVEDQKELPTLIQMNESYSEQQLSEKLSCSKEKKSPINEEKSCCPPLIFPYSTKLVGSNQNSKTAISNSKHSCPSFRLSFDVNKLPKSETSKLAFKLRKECEEAKDQLHNNKHLLDEEILKAYYNKLKAINERLEKISLEKEEELKQNMKSNKSSEESSTSNDKEILDEELYKLMTMNLTNEIGQIEISAIKEDFQTQMPSSSSSSSKIDISKIS